MANLGSFISYLNFPPNPHLSLRALRTFSQLWTPSFPKKRTKPKNSGILDCIHRRSLWIDWPLPGEMRTADLALSKVHIGKSIATDPCLPSLHDALPYSWKQKCLPSPGSFDLPQCFSIRLLDIKAFKYIYIYIYLYFFTAWSKYQHFIRRWENRVLRVCSKTK